MAHGPREGKAYHRGAGSLGLLTEKLDDLKVPVGEVDVRVGGHDVVAGALRELGAVGRVLAGEEARAEGAVGGHGDLLALADGEDVLVGVGEGETVRRLDDVEAAVAVRGAGFEGLAELLG